MLAKVRGHVTHPQVGGLEVALGGGAEPLRCHSFTFAEFGGDEDAAGSQADGPGGPGGPGGPRWRRQRGGQEAVHQGDGQGEDGLAAAALAAHLQQAAEKREGVSAGAGRSGPARPCRTSRAQWASSSRRRGSCWIRLT